MIATHVVRPTDADLRTGRLGFVVGVLLILASAAVVAGPVLYHAALAWWHAQGPARQADLEAVAGRVSWVPGYLGLLAVSFGVAWVLSRAFDAVARAVHPRGER